MQRLKQLAKAACLESQKLSWNLYLMKKRKFKWYGKRWAYVSPKLDGATIASSLEPSQKLWLMPPSCHRKKSEFQRSQSSAYRIRNNFVITTALQRQSENQGRLFITYQSGRVSLQCFLTLSMSVLCHLFSNHSSSRTMKTQLGRSLCCSTKSLSSLVPKMMRLASVCRSTLKWSRQYSKLRPQPPFNSPLLMFHSPVMIVVTGLFPFDDSTETTSNRMVHSFIIKIIRIKANKTQCYHIQYLFSQQKISLLICLLSTTQLIIINIISFFIRL